MSEQPRVAAVQMATGPNVNANLIEVERLLKQLQAHWLLGGGGVNAGESGRRISPLEVKP